MTSPKTIEAPTEVLVPKFVLFEAGGGINVASRGHDDLISAQITSPEHSGAQKTAKKSEKVSESSGKAAVLELVTTSPRDEILATVLEFLTSPQAQKASTVSGEDLGGLEMVSYAPAMEVGDTVDEVRSVEEGTLWKQSLIFEDSEEEEMGSLSPLQTLPPQIAPRASDWVLKKVGELQGWVGLTCDRYEERFMALLIAMEAGRPTAMKSAVRKERELKRLECSINYDNKEGTSGRDRSKGRDSIFVNEA
ncbi:uncharacterized protein LOC121236396 [Juglans microcarpa x Juglans regia]|uniref:uncharacterized protein LOC121236396 n=1 Tax=Juglans microcarpa x Juglans regia TaxID=2249226 RepID=UPI001B7F40B0|nr:uncharacterized protein LOC121236396 [Juglans microcarpa x Juglans regia]